MSPTVRRRLAFLAGWLMLTFALAWFPPANRLYGDEPSPYTPTRAAFAPVIVVPSPTLRPPGDGATPSGHTQGATVSGQAFALEQLEPVQFACLDHIVMHESHWRVDAGRLSGAYGIPQALPGSKMASAGADWRTNPVTQVRWLLGYVHGRYGTACQAWAFWRDHHWY